MERVGELELGADAASEAESPSLEFDAVESVAETKRTASAPERQASLVCPNLGSAACAACGGCPLMMMRPPSSSEEAPGEQPLSQIDELRALWRAPESKPATEVRKVVSEPSVRSKSKQPEGRQVEGGGDNQSTKQEASSYREQLMDSTILVVSVTAGQASIERQNAVEEAPSAPSPTEHPISQKIPSTSSLKHHEPKKQPLAVDQELPVPPHTTIAPEKPPKDTAPVLAAKSEQVTSEKSPTIRTEREISAETPVHAESIIAEVAITIPLDADVSHAPQPTAAPTPVRSVRETAEHQAITTPAPGDVVRPVATVPERPMNVEGGEIADEKPAPITVQHESVLQIPHESDVQQAPDDIASESSFLVLPDETIIPPEEPAIYDMEERAQPVVESDEQPEVIAIKNEETLVAHEAPVIKMSDEPKEFVPPAETVSEITNASMDADKIVPSPEPSASEETMVWRPDIVHTVVRDEQKDPPRDPIEENSAPQPTEQIAVRQSERVIEDVGAPHQKKVTIPHDAPEVTIDETMEMSDVFTPLFDLNSAPAPTITTQPAGLRAVLAALGFATLVVLRLRSAQRMDPAQQG